MIVYKLLLPAFLGILAAATSVVDEEPVCEGIRLIGGGWRCQVVGDCDFEAECVEVTFPIGGGAAVTMCWCTADEGESGTIKHCQMANKTAPGMPAIAECYLLNPCTPLPPPPNVCETEILYTDPEDGPIGWMCLCWSP